MNPVFWLIRYFRESKTELTKVTWPSKQDTTRYSVIIITVSVVIAIFFGGLDFLLAKGLEWFIIFN